MFWVHRDSLFLQHPGTGRVLVYDPQGDYARQFDADVPIQVGGALRLRGDSILVAEPYTSPEAFGLPLHLLTPDGKRVLSFGAEDRTVEPGRFFPRVRVTALESDSSFWVARRDRYQIELWNTAGLMERSNTLSREWFPPMSADPGDPSLAKPVAQLAGLHRDEHGHLVVVLLRARDGWKPRVQPPGGSESAVDPFEVLGHFETVVEILDPITWDLIATKVVPHVRTAGVFAPGGFLVGFAQTSDEALAFSLYTISH